MLVVEPLTSGLCGQNSTVRPTWQVRLKGAKACVQQSMPNHLQFDSEQSQGGGSGLGLIYAALV